MQVSRDRDWTYILTNGENLHVIVSTGSGTGTAQAVWERTIQPQLKCTGYAVHVTTSEGSVAELAAHHLLPKANQGIELSVLLLSGDGGILDIVNSILSSERSIAYKKPIIVLVPTGTGNALANSCGITKDKTQDLQTMLRGIPKELPLFRAKFSPGAKLLVNEGQDEAPLQGIVEGSPVVYGAVVCSWGHHATLVADSDTTEYRKHGDERFAMAAREALTPSDGSPPHAYKGLVSVRRPGIGATWEQIPRAEHGYILSTFVSQLAAGFTISPHSEPLDRKLRLVHFGALSGADAMEVMTKAFQGGKHIDEALVGYEEIEGLKIVFEDDARWTRVCIDGKIIRVGEGGWVEVSTDVAGVVDLVC